MATQRFSETLTDHATSPRNAGAMAGPDLTGVAGTPGRGAFLIMFLKVRDDRIEAARFRTHGCGPTIAAGSMLTELVVGRTIAECQALTAEDLIEALDGVPPDKLHCPALAVAALRDALARRPGGMANPCGG